ncbi:hypothetical protein ZWY2020_025373 [Hordeum vulgare]|nr:hypothetical protein ZWY2020_025373 [Hordeum vulgare]
MISSFLIHQERQRGRRVLRQRDGAPEVGDDLVSAGLRPSSEDTLSSGKTLEGIIPTDVRFDETNGSQREQLPPDPDKLCPEEAIKVKATEDIVPTKEIDEEIIPSTDENQEDPPEEIALKPIP